MNGRQDEGYSLRTRLLMAFGCAVAVFTVLGIVLPAINPPMNMGRSPFVPIWVQVVICMTAAAGTGIAVYLGTKPRIDVDHLRRCRSCGYIIEYLPEPRCPECGTGIDDFVGRSGRPDQ